MTILLSRRGDGGGYFEVLENEGQDNSSALKFARRSWSGDGIGQNLGECSLLL